MFDNKSEIEMPKAGEELSAVAAVGRYFGSPHDGMQRTYEPTRVGMSEQRDLSKTVRDELAAEVAKLTGCTIKSS